MATNAEIAAKLTDAMNARSLEAIEVLFSDDCVFISAGGSRRHEGPAAAAAAMMGWLSRYQDGSKLETVQEFYVDDEGFNEWHFTATTVEGEAAFTNGVDYFRFKDGKISQKSSFLKV